MLILAFADYLPPAERLARRLQAELKQIHLHRFPDQESLVRLPLQLPEHVILCRSLNDPNAKLIELLLCARTARAHGVKRLTLVAPYLCYMRQDFASHPGEAISQVIIGKLLADLFDDVITVDPHLHRIDSLQEAIPIDNAIALSATHEIADFLQNKLSDALLLGPDSESKQWVACIADETGFEYGVAEKIRHGDKQVDIQLPDMKFANKPVIIIDDMISTGRTLVKAANLLKNQGVRDIHIAITHPLFCGDAQDALLASGIHSIWSTDSILHPTSTIPLDRLLAQAVKTIL